MSHAREALAFAQASWSFLNTTFEQELILGRQPSDRLIAERESARHAIDYWLTICERQERVRFQPFRIGKAGGAIVTSEVIPGNHEAAPDDRDFYGGNLICESVAVKAVAHVLAAGPELLDVLECIRDADEDCKRDGLTRVVPEHVRRRLDEVIGKALGQ